MEALFFEIKDLDNFVKVQPIEFSYPDADNEWDKKWVKSKVEVKGGNFTGSYIAEFRTDDFKTFEEQLASLYNNLNGNAVFNDLEDYLELRIKGDGIGHFAVGIEACDRPGYGNRLSFELSFDQTQINTMLDQLNKITTIYP